MWKLKDSIDLIYFTEQDRQEKSEEECHKRDRDMALNNFSEEELINNSTFPMLTAWLSALRHQWPEETSPGDQVDTAAHKCGALIILAGCIFGIGGGLSFFTYTGKTPLNVFVFLLLFLLPQFLFLAILLFKATFSRFLNKNITLISQLFSSLFTLVLRRTTGRAEFHLRNLKLGEETTLVKTIIQPTLFSFSQLFAVAFNGGLLFITAFRVATTDLAFGWQTTLQFGAEKLSSLVQLMALPWSWFLPENISHPSLSQIEGSRIILKDGIYHLATENLISWWPFLLLALLVYGLLPRLLLWIFGVRMQRQALNRIMEGAAAQGILRRMRTPYVITRGAPETTSLEEAEESPPPQAPAPEEKITSLSPCILLVPDELNAAMDLEMVETLIAPCNLQVMEKMVLFRSYSDDCKIVEQLSSTVTPVIIILEAWMAPIGEQLDLIGQIAGLRGEAEATRIWFIGRPDNNQIFVQPQEKDTIIWREKLSPHSDKFTLFSPQSSMEHP